MEIEFYIILRIDRNDSLYRLLMTTEYSQATPYYEAILLLQYYMEFIAYRYSFVYTIKAHLPGREQIIEWMYFL